MNWLSIYKDFISNLFGFLSLNFFVNSFAECKEKKKQFPINLLFLCVLIVVSLIPTIPYYSFISLFISLLYVLVIVQQKLKTRLATFFKYELFYISCLFLSPLCILSLLWMPQYIPPTILMQTMLIC